MNNVGGFSFSEEDKMREYILVSLFSGWKTKEILIVFSLVFAEFLKGAFCRKSPIFIGWKDRSKSDKLPNPIENMANIKRQLSIFLL